MSKRTQLKRALSKLGWCSRGVADAWIAEGKVRVNGKPAASGEQWVELGVDRIEAEGRVSGAEAAGLPAGPAQGAAPRLYLALHKPRGYVTTRSDELGRQTVYDLLPEEARGRWVFPVGRLDKDSEGLLLLTDDGEWADRLSDPESHVAKVYRVKLDGRPLPEQLAAFRSGVVLDGKKTRPAEAVEDGTWIRVTLREGRNRQIRRMFHALGYKVKRLVRIAIGTLELGDLAAGKCRALAPAEAKALARAPR